MLKQYARDEKNGKRGVMVAFREDGEIKIGYSFVNPIETKTVTVELMEKMAIGRAKTDRRNRRVHYNKEDIIDFVGRVERYFNNPNLKVNKFGIAPLPVWAQELVPLAKAAEAARNALKDAENVPA